MSLNKLKSIDSDDIMKEYTILKNKIIDENFNKDKQRNTQILQSNTSIKQKVQKIKQEKIDQISDQFLQAKQLSSKKIIQSKKKTDKEQFFLKKNKQKKQKSQRNQQKQLHFTETNNLYQTSNSDCKVLGVLYWALKAQISDKQELQKQLDQANKNIREIQCQINLLKHKDRQYSVQKQKKPDLDKHFQTIKSINQQKKNLEKIRQKKENEKLAKIYKNQQLKEEKENNIKKELLNKRKEKLKNNIKKIKLKSQQRKVLNKIANPLMKNLLKEKIQINFKQKFQ